MIVRTTWIIPKPVAVVWPLLCDSQMDGSKACLFRCGVPRPIACRLPDGQGRVGATRHCVSDQGLTEQRILDWEPGRLLRFRMERTDAAYGRLLATLEDRFDLEALAATTRVTRTTTFAVKPGACPWTRAQVLALGLKQVHRYVFRNWSR